MNVLPRTALLLLVAAFLAWTQPPRALAQEAGPFQPYIAVVTGNDVYVRSGATDSYYPVAKVHRGELVRVVGEKDEWARLAAAGPTFADERFFGYIIHATSQTGRFRLEADGAAGVTLGRTDVFAPNLNARYNPNDSWKQLVRLEPDHRVVVMETREVGGNTVHKVRLPETAEVWISKMYVRRATAEEAKAWEKPRAAAGEAATKPAPGTAATETVATPPADDSPAQGVLAREAQRPPAVPGADAAAPTEPGAAPVAAPVVASDPVADKSEKPEPTTAEKLAEATLEDLEEAYATLRRAPLATAEVAPLRQMYLDLAGRSIAAGEVGAARFAEARAEQLKLWMDVQERQTELARIRARAQLATERSHAVRESVDAAGDYIAVGRLAVSNIYDGRRLPRLLRLQDTATGRTVAYLEPSETFDLIGMLGQLIGVVGERAYDGGLRLNIVTPRRIDVLAPQGP